VKDCPLKVKLTAFILTVTGGTLAITALMGLMLWVINLGLGFVPLSTGALGAFTCALLALFQSRAMGKLAPRGWISVTAAAGAIGVPIGISLSFPFLFVIGEFGIVIGGFVLGLCLGITQFLVLRKRYIRIWPWPLISAIALGTGFATAFPIVSSLKLGFYPPFSPGWSAVGTVAGFIYGVVTGFVMIYYSPRERAQVPEDKNLRAA
jgi:hypothetical protein